MQHRTCSLWTGVALGALVVLSGCGGLEKGPAPNLPYTPEPPAPKPEKKADVPKGLGPSLPVPIKMEPLTPPAEKKDGAAKTDEKKAAEPAKTEPAKTDVPEQKK
jgi:hypothetical protein